MVENPDLKPACSRDRWWPSVSSILCSKNEGEHLVGHWQEADLVGHWQEADGPAGFDVSCVAILVDNNY